MIRTRIIMTRYHRVPKATLQTDCFPESVSREAQKRRKSLLCGVLHAKPFPHINPFHVPRGALVCIKCPPPSHTILRCTQPLGYKYAVFLYRMDDCHYQGWTYWIGFCSLFFSFIFISWRLLYNIVVGFVMLWHESAMELRVFPIDSVAFSILGVSLLHSLFPAGTACFCCIFSDLNIFSDLTKHTY